MKKFILFLLAAAILSAGPLPSAGASAGSISTLSALQRCLEAAAPDDLLLSSPSVSLSGTVLEIRYCGQSNHYEALLQVEDPEALKPIGREAPVLILHFRLHLEAVPFEVGDLISFSGSVNALYSSVIIPNILADTINGSADF